MPREGVELFEIREYIEVFYNRIRRHWTIGYVSPAKFEEMNQAEAAYSTCPLFRNKVTLLSLNGTRYYAVSDSL